MSGHHCPLILGNPRPGYWFQCHCGETGRPMTSRAGASYEWALHVASRARRKQRKATA